MKLTDVVFRFAKRLPKGHIYRGKYRLVKRVTIEDLVKKREELAIEEQNMFYLRHPYLTEEQTQNHTKPFNKRQKFLEKHRNEALKWKDHGLLGDRFGFLKVSDKWE